MPTLTCPMCGRTKLLSNYDYVRSRTCSKYCSGRYITLKTLAERPVLDQPEGYRLIPVAGGSVVQVSIEDYDHLSSIAWHLLPQGYAVDRNSKRMNRIVMERVIGKQLAPKAQVDHEDNNPANNQRFNLRIATGAENARNRKLNSNSRTGFKGVSINRFGTFTAYIRVNNHQLHIGNFDDKEYAGSLYDQWALELHGSFANLNFDYVEVSA